MVVAHHCQRGDLGAPRRGVRLSRTVATGAQGHRIEYTDRHRDHQLPVRHDALDCTDRWIAPRGYHRAIHSCSWLGHALRAHRSNSSTGSGACDLQCNECPHRVEPLARTTSNVTCRCANCAPHVLTSHPPTVVPMSRVRNCHGFLHATARLRRR